MIQSSHSSSWRFVRISQYFFTLAFISICVFWGGTEIVYAQSADLAAEVATSAGLSSMSLLDIIGGLIHAALGLLGIVFLGLTLYAGWLWMTAAGDPKKTEKARQIILQATVGLIITLSAYAITSFVVGWLSGATGLDSESSSGRSVSVERLSGSLGSGALRDHYPERNATDVARNARIMVTFKNPMDIESFIAGYDAKGTPTDTSDDVVATAIASDKVSIYATSSGIESALTDVSVSFSEDLKTFIFDPAAYLGSPTSSVSYTVFLSPGILDAEGNDVFTGSDRSGYEWSFETGTTIDTLPPTVVSVVPSASGVYARNITVQMVFNEAIDPTIASGTRTSLGGFDAIQTMGEDLIPLEGTYEISNGYTTITFTPNNACGTNSCGETIYCLPSEDDVSVNARAATPGVNPPQVDAYPYDGIVDVSGNALDGNGDGSAGDDYMWSFRTTGSMELSGPSIVSITPDIKGEDVALDQTVSIIFDDVLLVNSVNSDNILMKNKELASDASHEMWYRFATAFLDASSTEVVRTSASITQTLVNIDHGTFLESIDGKTYVYGITVGDGIKNQYQNCYAPAEGPSDTGGTCAGPYCCNGVASATACTLF